MAVEVSPSGQIQEFVSVLKKRRWQIILPALFVLLMGTVFAVIVPKKFVIKTEIELREANLRAVEDIRQRKESPLDREVSVLENHLRNFSRIAGILEDSSEAWPEYAISDRPQRLGMVEAVIKNLKVDSTPPKEGSTFVNISYKDVVAQRGEDFLADVVKVAIDDILSADKLRLERDIQAYQSNYDSLKVSVDKARTEWNILAQEQNFDPTQAPGASVRGVETKHDRLSNRLEALLQRQGDRQREKKELELFLEQLEEELKDMPPTLEVPEQVISIDFEKLALDILQAESLLKEAEKRLKAFRPGAKRYRELAAERDRIAERLALGKAKNVQTKPAMLEQPNEAYVALQRAIKEKRDALYRNAEAQSLLQDDIREVQTSMDGLTVMLSEADTVWQEKLAWEEQLKEALADLTNKKKSLRQSQQFTRDVIMDVATPAYASETAEDPNPYLIIGFALFAGLGLGLGLALLSEYARNSYRSVPDLASVMSVPVIGSIGTIVTRREARRTLGMRLLVGVPTVVILAGVSWMTWTWSNEETRSTLPVSVQQAIDGIRISLSSM